MLLKSYYDNDDSKVQKLPSFLPSSNLLYDEVALAAESTVSVNLGATSCAAPVVPCVALFSDAILLASSCTSITPLVVDV